MFPLLNHVMIEALESPTSIWGLILEFLDIWRKWTFVLFPSTPITTQFNSKNWSLKKNSTKIPN